MKTKIGIDIADTIIDVWPSLIAEAEIYNKEHSNKPRSLETDLYLPEHIFNWDEEETKDFWYRYGQIITFNSSLRKGVRETLDYLKSLEYYLVFITAKSNDMYVDLEKNIVNLLKDNCLPYDEIHVQINNKGLFCRENGIKYLIDDSYRNCLSAKENGLTGILVSNPYNEDVELKNGIIRIREMTDIKKIITERVW